MDTFTIDHLLRIRRPTWGVPMHVAPDGVLLALTLQEGARRGGPYHNGFDANRVPQFMSGSRVWVVDTRTGESIEPFPAESTSWGGRWSPDGMRLAAYVQHQGAACVGIWLQGTGEVQLIREAPVWVFFGFEVLQWTPDSRALLTKLKPDTPEWDAEAGRRVQTWVQHPLQGTLWTTNGALLAITDPSGPDGRPWLARVALRDGKATPLCPWMRTETSDGYAMEVTPDGSACFLVTEAPERAFELWRIDQGFREPTRLRQLNPELERVVFGARSLISWRDHRGRSRQGALLLPPTYTKGQRVPLIVNVYGGEHGSCRIDQFGFGGYSYDNAHLLTARGYAVLWPDMPMEDHDPMRQLPSLVRAAVHRAIASGIADPDRLGIMGHSYGGYCVLALLAQTRLFRAAICSAGIVDLIGFYSDFWNGVNFHWSWAERGQGRLGGTPWEKREAYIRNSPFFFLDRVTAPVLLVAGTDIEEDARQAKAAFGALRRLDRTVELRLYRGEGHSLDAWSAGNLRDLSRRVLAWFDRYL